MGGLASRAGFRAFFLALLISLAPGPVSAQCVNLSDSGTYGTGVVNVSNILYVNENTTLCTDTYFINATASTAMLQINSSNIFLDCDNSILDGVTGSGYGIYMTAKENITVKNCMATLYASGMRIASSSKNINLTDNFVYNNSQHGIAIVGTSGARADNFTITNNRAWNSTNYGFYVEYMDNSIFANNTACLNKYHGFYILNSRWALIQNNNASNNSVGSSSYAGFQIYASSYNNLTNNTVSGNGDGLYLYFDNGYNILENNTANENKQNNFRIFNSVSSNFSGNVANNTNRISSTGFSTSGCTGCRFVNNYIRNCGGSGFASSDAGIVLINNTVADSGGSGYGFGIFSSACTVVNNTAINTTTGAAFYFSGVSNSNITGNLANRTVGGGNCFTVSGSSANANFTSNDAYGCSGSCLYVTSNSINMAGFSGTVCTSYGFLLSANYVNVRDASFSQASQGFYTTSAQWNNFTNMVAYANAYGIHLNGPNVKNNTFTNVTVYNNSDTGFYLPSSSLDNRFINSSTHSNTKYGIYLYQGSNIIGTNIHAYNNTLAEFYFSPWGSTTAPISITNLTIDNPFGNFSNYTSIDLLQTIAGGFTVYTIRWDYNSTALPASVNSSFAQKYINISNVSGTPTIDQMNFTWLNSELDGYDENRFQLWKYNASGWGDTGAALDTANNLLSLSSFKPGSIYGILERSDALPPNVTFEPPTPDSGIFSNASAIEVNVSAEDASGIANITIYLYNSSALFNHSNGTSGELFTTFAALPDGIYYFNATAYDTVGNYNSTETRNVTIDTVPPSVAIQIPANVTYNYTGLDLNFTASDLHLDSCWYALNGGAAVPLPGCANNTITAIEGQNSIFLYANDTAGNTNSTNVSFSVDTISPSVSIQSP
ncbi:MAG: right-handed parallel beta-helix repeat-containing protein, partial [Candidatus ainarchaeum sp.]|nr:right-handed parallel beta-helix repeat-containing protein [Candidatus ainarchaeum sp.]